MRMIVYGDFNCPYSYLASQRADRLVRLGTAEVDWRAVEHDPGLPVTGVRAESAREDWEAELAEVAGLALPGEDVPGRASGCDQQHEGGCRRLRRGCLRCRAGRVAATGVPGYLG